jgi:hypothetical protein
MSNVEQYLFSSVADQCADDVKRLCLKNEEDIEEEQPSQQRRMQGNQPNSFEADFESSTIFNDFHQRALEDFDMFFESFMRPHVEWVVVYDSTQSDRKNLSHGTGDHVATGHRLKVDEGDNFVRNIALNVPPCDFHHVSERLQEHGNSMLNRNDLKLTESGFRVARRLQEVSPEVLTSHRQSFLPFGSDSQCLETLYYESEGRALSSNCIDSMRNLLRMRTSERERLEQEDADSYFLFKSCVVMYTFVWMSIIIGASRNSVKTQREARLQERILAAVYSNPELKRDVELKVQESVGYLPPFSRIVMQRRGFFKSESGTCTSFTKSLYAAAWFLAWLCFVIHPLETMPILACLSVFWCIYATFFVKVSEPICTCCCCGMTTEDASNGVTSKDQACCGCCQGTGVCSVQCSSCCGPTVAGKPSLCCVPKPIGEKVAACCSCCGGKGCSCCSSKDCSCCSGKDCSCPSTLKIKSMKKDVSSEKGLYEAITVQIV